MIKKLNILFLALLILFQSGASMFTLLHFELNKDFIVKNLCINRSKPSMHCNGKCHLKKQLKKTEQQQNKRSLNNKEAASYTLHEKSIELMGTTHESSFKKIELPTQPVLVGYHPEIFHPPANC